MTIQTLPTSPAPTPATERPIVSVRDFRAAYGPKVIMEHLSFDIQRGEIFIVAGGSGCGKSTILRHIIGLQEPAAGTILIDGDNLTELEGDARRRVLRKFGVSYQGGALFGDMTVLENVRLPMEEFTTWDHDQMDMVAMAKLKLVNLEGSAEKMPAELSGGMQKRAGIARAISLDPTIVFLDEPSAGLDPVSSTDLDQLILDINDMIGTTFVVVTHELASIFKIADRVLMLDAGRKGMVAIDTPEKLQSEYADPIVKAFFNRQPNCGPEECVLVQDHEEPT